MSDVPPQRPSSSDPKSPVKPIVVPVRAGGSPPVAPVRPTPVVAIPVAPKVVPVAPKAVPVAPRAIPIAPVAPKAVPVAPLPVVPQPIVVIPKAAVPTPVVPKAVVPKVISVPAHPATPTSVPVTPRPVPTPPPPVGAHRVESPKSTPHPPPTRRELHESDPGETSAAVPLLHTRPLTKPAVNEPVAPAGQPVAPKLVEEQRRPTGPSAAPPPGKDPLIGTIVARCKILERIGQGKTAVVYRAEHLALNLPVAVKILHPSILEFPELVQKFEAEARAIARLDHPNVLKIYDVRTEGDNHAIVMELLVGESVLDLLQREGQVDAVDALRIVRQGAAGLEAAHGKGIIHRDVKPQNLVIMPDGTVKLVDFGLATATDDDEARTIRIGTPHYMSPEVCEARSVEPKSDVYSLGITLYHLLVGQPPYAGMSVKEILTAHIEAKPLEPEKRRLGLQKPIADLVRGMTKRDELTRLSVADVIATVDRIGGEELKANLKLKVGRGRHRRGGAQQAVPTVVILIGALVIIGAVVALVAGGGKDKSDPNGARRTPIVDATPPPVVPSVGIDPTNGMGETAPPTPPVETEAQRKAREADQAKKEADARVRQSWVSFSDAEAFARLMFEDKGAVVAKYRLVAKNYPDLDAGKTAKDRADKIAKGEMHPHPDRVYQPKTVVELAREAWETLRGQVETAITEFRYDDAFRLVPANVEDPEGKLSEEVEFYRQVTTDLVGFRSSLDGALDTSKPSARDIKLTKGVARVRRVRADSITVEQDGATIEIPWAAAPIDEIAALAKRAFAGKEPKLSVGLATFAWAHKRRESFWSTYLMLNTSNAMSGTSDPQLDKLMARAKDRIPR